MDVSKFVDTNHWAWMPERNSKVEQMINKKCLMFNTFNYLMMEATLNDKLRNNRI